MSSALIKYLFNFVAMCVNNRHTIITDGPNAVVGVCQNCGETFAYKEDYLHLRFKNVK